MTRAIFGIVAAVAMLAATAASAAADAPCAGGSDNFKNPGQPGPGVTQHNAPPCK